MPILIIRSYRYCEFGDGKRLGTKEGVKRSVNGIEVGGAVGEMSDALQAGD
jgi:hypothetical protein